MNEPYRPSNGTEGMAFISEWCDECIHDDPENEKFCPIVGATMMLDVDDPDYPKEWIFNYEENRPRCTAFKAKE